MKTQIIIMLLLVSNAFALKARITLRNPLNRNNSIAFVKGHIWNSNQLGSNTQNVMIDENKTVYFGPLETKTFIIKMVCIESYRPSPPNGTPISPTPIHTNSNNLDAQIKRAKARAKRVQNARGQVIR